MLVVLPSIYQSPGIDISTHHYRPFLHIYRLMHLVSTNRTLLHVTRKSQICTEEMQMTNEFSLGLEKRDILH